MIGCPTRVLYTLAVFDQDVPIFPAEEVWFSEVLAGGTPIIPLG